MGIVLINIGANNSAVENIGVALVVFFSIAGLLAWFAWLGWFFDTFGERIGYFIHTMIDKGNDKYGKK